MADDQDKETGNPNKNPEEPEVEEGDLNEFGDDEDLDLLDAEELAQKVKKLKKMSSSLLAQKKWQREQREKEKAEKEKLLQELQELKKANPQKGAQPDEIEQKIEAKLREREIEGLDVSDKIKQEIKRHLDAGTFKSVKEAKNSDYIQYLIQKEQEKEKQEKASISPTHTGKGGVQKDFSEMSLSDFDLTTKEGREKFAEYKKWLKTQE